MNAQCTTTHGHGNTVTTCLLLQVSSVVLISTCTCIVQVLILDTTVTSFVYNTGERVTFFEGSLGRLREAQSFGFCSLKVQCRKEQIYHDFYPMLV